MADCQAVVEIKNDLIRTMGECRDVTDQYQTGRSASYGGGEICENKKNEEISPNLSNDDSRISLSDHQQLHSNVWHYCRLQKL